MRNLNAELAKLYPAHFNRPFDFSNVGYVGSLSVGRWDWEDNFSSDGWSDTGSKMFVSGGVLNWDAEADGSDHSSRKDPLGVALSDVAWIYRCDAVIDAISNPSNETQIMDFGLSSTNTGQNDSGDTGDKLSFGLWNNSSGSKQIKNLNADGGWIASPTNNNTLSTSFGVGNLGIQQIRKSSTTMDLKIYPDFTYGTPDDTDSLTINSTTQSLRYFVVANWNRASVGSAHDGTIGNLKLSDGVTTPP